MRSAIAVLMILACVGTGNLSKGAEAEQFKVPAGCRAAEGATASHEGYANRIIHEKTAVEMILEPTGEFAIGSGKESQQMSISTPFYLGKTEVISKEFHTHSVAGKLPNDWGLYDMLGNVWEPSTSG